MLHPPCCRNGWYHRHCLQSYANSAGYFFKCPLCNNNTVFNDVALRGISVPNSDASWESDPNAYVEQTQRDQMCTADRCICGTRYVFAESLMYCILCGANPAHPFCSSQDENTYTCKVCSPVSEGIQVADDPEDQVEDQESQDEQDGHDNARDEDYVPEAEDAEDTEEDEKKQPNKPEAMEESDSDDDRIMLLAYSISVGRRHVRRSNSPSTSQTPSYNLRSLSNQENAPPTAALRRSQRRSLTVFLPGATELAPSDEENKEDKPSGPPAPEDPLATPRRFLRSLSPVAGATRSSARIQNRRQPLLTQADSTDAASSMI